MDEARKALAEWNKRRSAREQMRYSRQRPQTDAANNSSTDKDKE